MPTTQYYTVKSKYLHAAGKPLFARDPGAVPSVSRHSSELWTTPHRRRDYEARECCKGKGFGLQTFVIFYSAKPRSSAQSFLSALRTCTGTCNCHIVGALLFVFQEFQRQSNLLFTILSGVRHHQSSPHLTQLLLRLDYNKYFTQAGGQLGR